MTGSAGFAQAGPPADRSIVLEGGLSFFLQHSAASNDTRRGNCFLFTGSCTRIAYSSYVLNRKAVPYLRLGKQWEEHELTLSLMTFGVDVEEFNADQSVIERTPTSTHRARLTPLTLGYRWFAGRPHRLIRYFMGLGFTYNLRTGYRPENDFRSSSMFGPYSGIFTPVGFRIGRGGNAAVVECLLPPQVRLGYRKRL